MSVLVNRGVWFVAAMSSWIAVSPMGCLDQTIYPVHDFTDAQATQSDAELDVSSPSDGGNDQDEADGGEPSDAGDSAAVPWSDEAVGDGGKP